MKTNFRKSKRPAEAKTSRTAIAQGMYFSDRCLFCHEFNEKIKPFLCVECWDKIKAAIAEYGDELQQAKPESGEAEQRGKNL